MEYLSIRQTADRWGISIRRIQVLCTEGRIPGAMKIGSYWAIPAEFLKKSGDCEDYAIVKYFTLKELGIPAENMRIVVVRDTLRNLAHAVLAVYLNGDAYILDNLSNTVLSHSRIRQYSPQYSVNESGRWAHLKGRKLK